MRKKWSQVPFCCLWHHVLLVACSVNSPVATIRFVPPNLLVASHLVCMGPQSGGACVSQLVVVLVGVNKPPPTPRPHSHRMRNATHNAMQANGTYCCQWECSHCWQATSKEKRSNLRARQVTGPVCFVYWGVDGYVISTLKSAPVPKEVTASVFRFYVCFPKTQFTVE